MQSDWLTDIQIVFCEPVPINSRLSTSKDSDCRSIRLNTYTTSLQRNTNNREKDDNRNTLFILSPFHLLPIRPNPTPANPRVTPKAPNFPRR